MANNEKEKLKNNCTPDTTGADPAILKWGVPNPGQKRGFQLYVPIQIH